MSGSYQLIHEYRNTEPTAGKVVHAGQTMYMNLTPASNWDSVYGIWFYVLVHTVGGANVTLTLQGASDPNQSTWVDIGVGVALTGGTEASPVESSFTRTPLTDAENSFVKTLPPFLRLKIVSDALTESFIHRVSRTVRGLK